MNYTISVDWDTAEALMRDILKGEMVLVKEANDTELLKALIEVYNYFSPRSEQMEMPKC